MPIDPFQDYLSVELHPLDAVFKPQKIALFGAKDDPGTVGATLLKNLRNETFKGKVYPINPNRKEVFGSPCYPSIESLPEKVELAVIATPAKTVPGIMDSLKKSGVTAAVVISAGFKEAGEEGAQLEQEVIRIARQGGISVIGPNCLGVMNPLISLNATFAKGMALPGNLAFISQSGALLTSVLDWSFQEKIGFSGIVSIGSMADVDWGQLIDYYGQDPQTEAIILYMESVGCVRSFLSAARQASLEKPIILIKAGRSEQSQKAAASHTGAMAGSDKVFDTALKRTGILRVNTIGNLFDMAAALSKQKRPKGPNLAIITNAGGPAVLATDAVIYKEGKLASLSPSIIKTLSSFLPDAWSRSNPIDLLGDATPDQYAQAVEVIADCDEADAILIILTPQDVTDATETARKVAAVGEQAGKPILASWMGGPNVQEGIKVLNDSNIPTFSYPDEAAKTFGNTWKYSKNLSLIYQCPSLNETAEKEEGIEETEKRRAFVDGIFDKARENDLTLLDERQSKQILKAYGIPIVETEVARTKEEAVALSEEMGYPVVLKIFSRTVTHKRDVGGVELNLQSQQEVEAAFERIHKAAKEKAGIDQLEGVSVQKMISLEGTELIIGATTDPIFGPVLMFGLGGELVEVLQETELALPPLNRHLAGQLIQSTKANKILKGIRGRKPVDMDQLENLLVRFSQMIAENPQIKECDINPLLAAPGQLIALDCRFSLYPPNGTRPELAVRPYPHEYKSSETLKDGTAVNIRPILPEDEERMISFHRELSEESVRLRYLASMSLDERISRQRLASICLCDWDREIVLVTEYQQGIIGVARLSRIPGTQAAQIRMIINDAWHGKGLGTQLFRILIDVAKKEGYKEIRVLVLEENRGMLRILEKLDFTVEKVPGTSYFRATLMTS